MLRNIFTALLLFAAIAAIGFYLSDWQDKPVTPTPSPRVISDGTTTLLPAGDFTPRHTLPPMTLQTTLKSVTLRFYRVTDPAVLLRLYRGVAHDSLSSIALAQLVAENLSPFATQDILPHNNSATVPWQKPSEGDAPGLYVLAVAPDATAPALAATWFLRTNLQLIVAEDRSGWHVLCQNLQAPGQILPAALDWYGLGADKALDSSRCDNTGRARLEKTQLAANNLPQLLIGKDAAGNIAFVPLRTSRFEADAWAQARMYLATDRASYRAGQQVGVLAVGLGDTPAAVKLSLIRPDGLALEEKTLADLQARTGWQNFTLPNPAMAGRWKIATTAAGGVYRETEFTVTNDDAPVTAQLRLLDRRDQQVTLAAVLNDAAGNPLRTQAAEITLQWAALRQIPNLAADYAFGGYDAPDGGEQVVARFVSSGNHQLTITLPPPPDVSYPLQALLRVRPLGKPVAEPKSLAIPLVSKPWALGLKPEIEAEKLRPGDKASVKIALFKTGDAATPPPLSYELVTERRSYRWFFADGRWTYKSDVATMPTLTGTVTLEDGNKGSISVPVQSGQYRLHVFTPDRKLQTSWRFQVAAPQSEPVMRDLTLEVQRNTEHKLSLSTTDQAALTVIASDDSVRQMITMPKTPATTALDAALPLGGHLWGLAAQPGADGRWEIARKLLWVPPQEFTPLQAARLTLPQSLVAGTTTELSVTLPVADKARYLQFVTIPLEGDAVASALTARQRATQPPQAMVTSTIPVRWDQENSPASAQNSAAAASSFSMIATVAPGTTQVKLPLLLPQHRGKAALHMLVWDDTGLGEKILPITLSATAVAVKAPAPIKDAAPVPPRTLETNRFWSCSAALMPDDTTAVAAQRDGVFAVAPLPLPDVPALLTQLYTTQNLRSDNLAQSMTTLAAYENELMALKIDAAAMAAWRSWMGSMLLARQQGDGGVALYPEQAGSNLSASAFTLLAWKYFPAAIQAPSRLAALQNFLRQRLDTAWNAEQELYGRSDAFYALALTDTINPATLRYFIEQHGNAIRHAVYEARLAVALQKINDQEQSRAFVARAVAQLPSLKIEQPARALQVLAILIAHDLIPAAEGAARLAEIPATTPSSSMTVASIATLWPELARRLPEWQTMLGTQPFGQRGILLRAADAKMTTTIRVKGATPLHVCTDHGASRPTPASTAKAAVAPLITRQLFTPNGQPLKQPRLLAGTDALLLVTIKQAATGSGEVSLTMPPGLRVQAIIPGGVMAGQYGWLKQLDPVVAQMITPNTARIAFDRAEAGELKLAVILRAVTAGKPVLPPIHFEQFGVAYQTSADRGSVE